MVARAEAAQGRAGSAPQGVHSLLRRQWGGRSPHTSQSRPPGIEWVRRAEQSHPLLEVHSASRPSLERRPGSASDG
jgi:hypothetical protein